MANEKRQLKFYYDVECTKQVQRNEKGEAELRFPKAKAPVGGEEVSVDYYVRNETADDFTVTEVPTPSRTRVKIHQGVLYPKRAVKLTVTFTPEKDSEVPLNVKLKIKGYYMIKPK